MRLPQSATQPAMVNYTNSRDSVDLKFSPHSGRRKPRGQLVLALILLCILLAVIVALVVHFTSSHRSSTPAAPPVVNETQTELDANGTLALISTTTASSNSTTTAFPGCSQPEIPNSDLVSASSAKLLFTL